MLKRPPDMLDSDSDQLSSSEVSSPRDGHEKSIIIPNFGAVQHNPNKRIPLMGTWRLQEGVQLGRCQRTNDRSPCSEDDVEFVFRHKSRGVDAKYSAVRKLPVNGHHDVNLGHNNGNEPYSNTSGVTKLPNHTDGYSGDTESIKNDSNSISNGDLHVRSTKSGVNCLTNKNNAFVESSPTRVEKWLSESPCEEDFCINEKRIIVNRPQSERVWSENDNGTRSALGDCNSGNINHKLDLAAQVFVKGWKFNDNFSSSGVSLLYTNTPSLTFCQKKRLNFMKLCLRRNQPFYFLEMARDGDRMPCMY